MSDQNDIAEEWRMVPGHPLHEVSNLGRVRSWRRPGGREHVRATTPKLLKPWIEKSHGYPYVGLGRGRKCAVHRLVLLAFVGPCPAGMESLHRDGVRANPMLSNLRWGTKLENMADQVAHGTRVRGERHPMTRVDEATVIALREEFARGGVTQTELAERHGLGGMTTCHIIRGTTWSHVPMPANMPPRRGWGGGRRRPSAPTPDEFRPWASAALSLAGGNVSKAARLLGLARTTFVEWMRQATPTPSQPRAGERTESAA